FFQAEDGIRDFHVTGVQTCALPIYMMHLITENGGKNIMGVAFDQLHLKEIEERVKGHRFVKDAEVYKDLQGNLVVKIFQNIPMRSEERRVGKECRSRWRTYHEKEK